jgi:hypothetical protein
VHPRIHLTAVDYYEFDTFNQIIADQSLILSAKCWSQVHPLIKTVPVSWDYCLPYGVIYSKTPSEDVLQFISALEEDTYCVD